MNKRDFLLLSGTSTFLLVAPPVSAQFTNELIPIKDSPTIQEDQQLSDDPRLVEQDITPQNAQVSSPEEFSPDFSSEVTPISEPLQSVAQVAENAVVQTTPETLKITQPSEPLQSVVAVVDAVAQTTQETTLTPTPLTDPPVVAESVSPTLEEANSTAAETRLPKSSMEQVTSVSELSDVQPTDWAFEALRSLVERYGAIAGDPDGTFQGDRAMTRYEFAAGLNAVLNKVNELVANGFTNQVTQDDLAALQRLQADYAAELATLKGRVDSLEERTSTIEAQQFSTTTKLGGQVIFGLAAASGGDPPGTGEDNAVFTHLTQLQLLSSFTGRDFLRIGLATSNFEDNGFANPGSLNTNMSRLSFQDDLDNQLELNALDYRFSAFGDRVVFTFQPVGFSLSSVLSTNSPYTGAGQGAISRFGESSPIFKIGSLDAGLGFDWLVSNRLRLQVAYGTRESSNPLAGFVGADHSALGAQLLYKPTASLIAGLAYVNAYASDGRLDTATGSFNADVSGGFNEPAQIHALNATLQWRIAPKVIFGAWGGAVVANSVRSDAITLSSTYLVSLGLTDPFGREGDLLALLVGQPPKLNAGLLIERADEGSSLHYELFYRFRVNDNISVTPGVFLVTNPGHISENNTIVVGAVRTTFSF